MPPERISTLTSAGAQPLLDSLTTLSSVNERHPLTDEPHQDRGTYSNIDKRGDPTRIPCYACAEAGVECTYQFRESTCIRCVDNSIQCERLPNHPPSKCLPCYREKPKGRYNCSQGTPCLTCKDVRHCFYDPRRNTKAGSSSHSQQDQSQDGLDLNRSIWDRGGYGSGQGEGSGR